MAKKITWLAVTFAWAFAPLASAQDAVPTLGDLANINASSQLIPADEQKLDAYVKHWVGVMEGAKAPAEVEKARKALETGYEVHQNSVNYQLPYSRAMSAHAPRVLDLKDNPLRQLKEVNIAIAAAKMSQVGIMPMLSKMLAHGNPAVRYWAAKAFRHGNPQLGPQLMIHGGQYTRDMLKGLEAAGQTEKSGPVLYEILRAASPYRNVPAAAAGAQTQLRNVQADVILARCNDIYAGDVKTITAVKDGISFLGGMVSGTNDKSFLQILADVLEAASRAYLEDDTRGGEAGPALRDLLIELEQQLGNQTGASRKPIQEALSNTQDDDAIKATKIRLAVNNTWKAELAKLGVKTRYEPPAKPATTAPAEE